MVQSLATLAAAYLLGSIPTALWVARRRGVDIRAHGSGNVGATNALRVLGRGPGLLVLGVDVAKGAAAAALGRTAAPELVADGGIAALIAGSCAVLGHIWPVLARFRGGKGVATAVGVLAVVRPAVLVVLVPLFVGIAWATRRAAVASLIAAASLPAVLVGLRELVGSPVAGAELLFSGALLLLLAWTHRSNLRNLAAGREPGIDDRP